MIIILPTKPCPRKLYLEGSLHAPVRLELARAVHVFFKADPAGQWCSVPAKKKKDGKPLPSLIPFLSC